jgi:hypothetical protein
LQGGISNAEVVEIMEPVVELPTDEDVLTFEEL